MTKKIGFVGCGNMGEAFLKGIINSQIVDKKDIFVYARSKNDIIEKNYSVNICHDEKDVITCSDIIFLAVKPNVYPSVIEKIKDVLSKDKIIISMAAGLSIKSVQKDMIEKNTNQILNVVRTMPNLPLMVGQGCIAYTFSEEFNDGDKSFIRDLFGKMAVTIEIKEQLYDAVTAVSGSSPAFVFMFIEALADGAVLGGLPRKDAYRLIAQTVVGCGKMVLESGKHPGELKDNVCSPGGTTIEGVKALEDKKFRGAVIDAVVDTIEKSKKMSK